MRDSLLYFLWHSVVKASLRDKNRIPLIWHNIYSFSLFIWIPYYIFGFVYDRNWKKGIQIHVASDACCCYYSFLVCFPEEWQTKRADENESSSMCSISEQDTKKARATIFHFVFCWLCFSIFFPSLSFPTKLYLVKYYYYHLFCEINFLYHIPIHFHRDGCVRRFFFAFCCATAALFFLVVCVHSVATRFIIFRVDSFAHSFR